MGKERRCNERWCRCYGYGGRNLPQVYTSRSGLTCVRGSFNAETIGDWFGV